MIDRYGVRVAGQRRANRVEIRLAVLAIIVTLLALLPAVAGAREVERMGPDEAVAHALDGSRVVDGVEPGLLSARGDRFQARSEFLPER